MTMNYKPDLVESSTVDPLSHTAIFKLEIDLIPDVSEVVKCKPYVDLSQLDHVNPEENLVKCEWDKELKNQM